MPPRLPNQVATRFARRIGDVTRDFNELKLAVYGKKRQASLETMLAEQAMMSIAVQWEAFVNDLITAYVVERPKSTLLDFDTRLRQSIDDKFPGVARWIHWSFPRAISRPQAEKLLDPKGWNVVAPSAQALADMANRRLEAVDARKFSLAADDRDFIDYLVSLRNYLGHRSAGSRQKLLDSIAQLKPAGVNAPLKADLRQTGAYLKQVIAGGESRVTFVASRVQDIAAKLV